MSLLWSAGPFPLIGRSFSVNLLPETGNVHNCTAVASIFFETLVTSMNYEKSGALILGISCFYHDSAACLVRDGEIVAAGPEVDRKIHCRQNYGIPLVARMRETGRTLIPLAAHGCVYR